MFYQQYFLLNLSNTVYSSLTHKYIIFKVTSSSLHWFRNISSSPKSVQLVFLSHMAFAFCMTWSRSTEHLLRSMLTIWVMLFEPYLPLKWVSNASVSASKIWMDSSFLHTMVIFRLPIKENHNRPIPISVMCWCRKIKPKP